MGEVIVESVQFTPVSEYLNVVVPAENPDSAPHNVSAAKKVEEQVSKTEQSQFQIEFPIPAWYTRKVLPHRDVDYPYSLNPYGQGKDPVLSTISGG